MQHIGIDVGRNFVKVVSPYRKLSFKSAIGEWRRLNLESTDDYEVSINGIKYFVGDLAQESYFQREMASESKIHEETKILFLTALGVVGDSNKKISITTGLPVNQHTPEIKEKLTQLLVGKHTVQINKEMPEEFVIDSLNIVPEGAATPWDLYLDTNGLPRQSLFLNAKIRAIDIGSRTINYCTIDKRKFLDRESGTLNYGVIELLNANPNPTQEVCEQFVRKIVADLSKKWLTYNQGTDMILLVGGGAILLQKYFKQHFPLLHIADDPLFANASGYYKMGLAKANRQQQTAK